MLPSCTAAVQVLSGELVIQANGIPLVTLALPKVARLSLSSRSWQDDLALKKVDLTGIPYKIDKWCPVHQACIS